ncbi:undecaprenyl-diphosphate phosphatase [Frigidibacter sp. RF13]|uniref:undecaprenyl-diphosphate phosphatase n=1 Tax=Frigidibacter sp. RF13 TaxID=2997340 RepID=UPI00226F3820|nr:undecaprenyl-diphosphate phosphatase [Frigidibacter sp. RF13]MCY1126663.1 undecaprenyl-diphosphate phosphatase [Frigidibacter sp. RF13]
MSLAPALLDTAPVAAFLGVLEGATEFIPVSSTGHILLAGHFLGFESAGKTFEVVIQLGAILAVMGVYAARLLQMARGIGRDPKEMRFLVSILLAFFPAALVGLLAHDLIKTVFFESPRLIATMLVLGGIVLLVVDRLPLRPRHHDTDALPFRVALGIGIIQCLALIPGVSRSGSTIVGGLFLGADKRTAAEFSFFLSMPTMSAAFAYDLWKNRDVLDTSAMGEIAIGFVLAFLSALVVVRWVLGYVSRRGFALFGWWRIIVGCLAWAALWAGF